ncbi:catalase [Candidatus Nitrotoga arctica]|uniref:catalase n=1 Tax=Candidatus Nitrotoga arctica TaxID=453162 RepID=A0ABM8Z0K0_9PROT|nr:catalase [Candidatus Nitrotoga arctica]CAG9933306.1 putative Catalase [Candidatus Nitrotoga arctica]
MSSSDKNSVSDSTTGSGAPAASDRNSLTIGANGPIVLHDVHFLEQMAHFNREKVPERRPHAKGSDAFGMLQITEDIGEHPSCQNFWIRRQRSSSRLQLRAPRRSA